MKIYIKFSCDCGFEVERTFYTNVFGYFEIPQSYCPNDFNVLTAETKKGPMELSFDTNNLVCEVKDADKR